MFELFEVVEQEIYVDLENSDGISLVSFNIDELEFESENEMINYMKDKDAYCDRLEDDDGIIFYEKSRKKYDGALDEIIYDFENNSVSYNYANFDSFKTYDEADLFRKNLIKKFQASF